MGKLNLERAAWAESAVDAFQIETGTDDENAVADLLCNIMHLCRFEPQKYGEFEDQLERARANHAGEVADDE